MKRPAIAALCSLVLMAQTPAAPLPPYWPSMLRLAELMGALHHLAPLCGNAVGTVWRDRAAELIDAEGEVDADRRARLTGAFNRGYRAFAQTYRVCTPAAEATIAAYRREGAAIAADLVSRYGR